MSQESATRAARAGFVKLDRPWQRFVLGVLAVGAVAAAAAYNYFPVSKSVAAPTNACSSSACTVVVTNPAEPTVLVALLIAAALAAIMALTGYVWVLTGNGGAGPVADTLNPADVPSPSASVTQNLVALHPSDGSVPAARESAVTALELFKQMPISVVLAIEKAWRTEHPGASAAEDLREYRVRLTSSQRRHYARLHSELSSQDEWLRVDTSRRD